MSPRGIFRLCLSAFAAALCGSLQAATPDLASCDQWQPAASCNFQVSSRPGSYPIQYVIIHKVQGTAAGSASWFQNCASGVSAHYNFNNTTGYCYQSVREKDIAWHAGNSTTNARSVGIEHGGYVTSNDTADVCYRESGLETRSCIVYYSVTWDRSHVIGHIQVPGSSHTDPGNFWNWNYYMSCCNTLAGGAIRDKWLNLGGGPGFLGNPTTGELATPDTIGRYNHFNGGSIYWTPSNGAWSIRGDIKTKWSQLGWETGVCGYPITDENATPDGVGRYNHFSKGASIYWTPSTGAKQVGGAIKSKWAALGWETGVCGYPATDESAAGNGGRFNHFTKNNASIYYHSATGAWCVQGAIKNKWAELGWENGVLGYPTSDEYDIAGGKRSNFQGGTLTWTAATGVVTMP